MLHCVKDDNFTYLSKCLRFGTVGHISLKLADDHNVICESTRSRNIEWLWNVKGKYKWCHQSKQIKSHHEWRCVTLHKCILAMYKHCSWFWKLLKLLPTRELPSTVDKQFRCNLLSMIFHHELPSTVDKQSIGAIYSLWFFNRDELFKRFLSSFL